MLMRRTQSLSAPSLSEPVSVGKTTAELAEITRGPNLWIVIPDKIDNSHGHYAASLSVCISADCDDWVRRVLRRQEAVI